MAQAVGPTGVPIPARGKWIHPDSVAKPKTVPAGIPNVIPAHPNIHIAGPPQVAPIPKNLTVITPGKGGVPPPDTIKIEGKVVPALQPPAIPALQPKKNEGPVYDIQFLDVDQGLSSNNITSMIEDKRGQLWFGTVGDGVNRYDGQHFFHYTTNEGLIDNHVFSILEDSRGHLWFGNCGGGVSRYDGQNFTQFNLEGDPSNCISQLFEDSRGNIWLGSLSDGVTRYDGIHFIQYTERQGLSNNNIQSIEEDRQGNLWFGTATGLNRFDGVSFTRYTTNEGLVGDVILSIEGDRQGRIWLGTARGVSQYDGQSFTNYTIMEGLNASYIRYIKEDRQGNLWFSTLGGGVSCFDGKAFISFTKNEGLNSNSFNFVLEDSRGGLWMGGANGVCRLDTRSFVNFTEKEGLAYSSVSSIIEDRQGNLWFGTSNGALLYDGSQFFNFTSKEGLGLRSVEAILEDNQGSIWFGGSGGATRYDGKNFTHYSEKEGLSDYNVLCMLEDRQGDIWLGTERGDLSRFDGKSFTHFTEKEGLSFNKVFCMIESRQGGLWFGTYGGGISYYDGNNFTHYSEKEGLKGNAIISLFEDSRERLWVGAGAGVQIYGPGGGLGSFTDYTTKDGLSHNSLRSILEDGQHRIWLGTRRGISVMVPQPEAPLSGEPGPYKCFTFGKEDGLNTRENRIADGFLDSRNRIWWGTSNGITMLDLNQFELPSQPPRILLDHIEMEQAFIDFRRLSDTAYHHTFSFGEALVQAFDSIVPFFNYPAHMRLPHYINDLAFHFTGIDWAAPHKLQYSYQLEGLDEGWSPPTKESKIEFRNLPFGTFTFKVRAIGQAQAWSKPFEYPFTIRPPWYRTWWAYALWAALLSGSLYAFYRFQLARRLAQAEARQLRELDAVKNRLYTNITHEFRTPLTIIKGIAGQLQPKVEYKVREELKRIQHNGQHLLNLVNQMLDLAKLESGGLSVNKVQGDLMPFLKYQLESFHSLADVKNITLQFHSTEDNILMDFDPGKLQQIVSNLLSNAIKFTGHGGQVALSVGRCQLPVAWPKNQQTTKKKAGPYLSISVSDTGAGISEEKLPHIFDRFYQIDDSATRSGEGTGIGLTLAKELVKLLGGRIEVESELGKGATFNVFLPIANEADAMDAPSTGAFADTIDPVAEQTIASTASTASTAPIATLLIIEDNVDVTHYLSTLLRPNYRLLTAPNGKAGLDVALQEIPDIILCDVMMPEMDGYEVCRRLKGGLPTSHIPIILLTARADFDSRIEGLEQGADAYLAKPFEEKELKVHLKRLLENRERLRNYYTSNGFIARIAQPPAGEGRPSPADQEFFEKLLAAVEDNLSDPDFSAEQLADALFVSYATCLRKVKALTNCAVKEYIRQIRIHRAAQLLLEEPGRNIGAIAGDTGFNSNTHFTREFRKVMGCTPTEYRKG